MPQSILKGCADKSTIRVIILAGGKGSRMSSETPKVLQKLAGKPILTHVLEKAYLLSDIFPIVVYGEDLEQHKKGVGNKSIKWVYQDKPLGTAHAVEKTIPYIKDTDTVLIMYADIPLVSVNNLKKLIKKTQDEQFTILTADINIPEGYGRIIRDKNKIVAIRECVDLKDDQKLIKECNTGFMAVNGAVLKNCIPLVRNQNKQKEYYLTDCVSIAIERGIKVSSIKLEQEDEITGINDMAQLAKAERIYQTQLTDKLMKSGVRIIDPFRVDIRGSLKTGVGATIDCNVIFEGDVVLGDNVYVGPNSFISHSYIGDDVQIKSNCVIVDAEIGRSCQIGPFARIRPSTILEDDVAVGNFVEIKGSKIGSNTKANHLSYVGDANIGSNVNIGAGTITCNYDGVSKHETIIENDVFIGSNSELIAPVKINSGSTVAAGSTITKDVASESLAISRSEQKQIARWRRPKK